jgi:hypothetical protein
VQRTHKTQQFHKEKKDKADTHREDVGESELSSPQHCSHFRKQFGGFLKVKSGHSPQEIPSKKWQPR